MNPGATGSLGDMDVAGSAPNLHIAISPRAIARRAAGHVGFGWGVHNCVGQMLARMEGEVMVAALAQLPPRMRAVLVLRYWEDLSEQTTADLLGCSVGAVKSQASRGLARLRRDPGQGRRRAERP